MIWYLENGVQKKHWIVINDVLNSKNGHLEGRPPFSEPFGIKSFRYTIFILGHGSS